MPSASCLQLQDRNTPPTLTSENLKRDPAMHLLIFVFFRSINLFAKIGGQVWSLCIWCTWTNTKLFHWSKQFSQAILLEARPNICMPIILIEFEQKNDKLCDAASTVSIRAFSLEHYQPTLSLIEISCCFFEASRLSLLKYSLREQSFHQKLLFLCLLFLTERCSLHKIEKAIAERLA